MNNDNVKLYILQAYSNSRAHGWWEGEVAHDPVIFKTKLLLVMTEIAEAVESYRRKEEIIHYVDGKPEGILAELADVFIRLCALAGALGWEPASTFDVEYPDEGICEMSVLDHLWALNTKNIEVWNEFEVTSSVSWEFESLLLTTIVAGYAIGTKDTFIRVVEEKMAHNRSRPYRHGGKAI